MKNLFAFLLLLSISTFLACKGEMGPAGLPGKNGIDGTDGQDGNANVKSFTFHINSTDWTWAASEKLTFHGHACPIITQAIYEKGMVQVFARGIVPGSGGNWTSLPFSYLKNNGGTYEWTENWHYHYPVGEVWVNVQQSDGLPVYYDLDIKVVAATSQGLAQNPNLDWTNYDLVKETFQLPE